MLIAQDGHAKVADFGIAKTADAADQTLTGQIFATPAYLAPEQVAGSSASPQSDLYSLGVVLYEALSGRPPYADTTPLAVLRAIEQTTPPPLDDARPGLPPHLVAAIKRAMARDPRKRFASAEDMAAAIDPAVSAAVPGPAKAETVQISAGDHDGATRTLAPLPPPGARGAPRPRLGQRARARVVAVAVGCVVVVAVMVAIASGSGDPVQPLVPATPDDGRISEQTLVPSTTPTTSPPAPAPVVEGGGNGGKGKGNGKGKG